MKIQQFLSASFLMLGAWIMSEAAQADTVLYDSASVVAGQEAFTQSFEVTAPGRIYFSVSNIPWLDVVADLTSFLSTTTGVVGTTMYSAGTESVNVGPGMYYAHWFGDAQGTYNEGVLGVKIQFQPLTTVPLPASWMLMISGLGVLFGWQRRKTLERARPID
jgi:hypothetical protein